MRRFLVPGLLFAALGGCTTLSHTEIGPDGRKVHVILVQTETQRTSTVIATGDRDLDKVLLRRARFEARAAEYCPASYDVIAQSGTMRARGRAVRRETDVMRIVCRE